jgi:catechol 2,3-dioxygenase-like lactoylglutathione lyase family enzyme
MTGKSAVEFATEARLHVALESSDVARSSRFYATLFGQEPSKVRPGYVRFEVESSPLNLSLNQVIAGVRRTAMLGKFS